MTKMIKMSLIAAVAVTGMTSVATAQPLEEAIKGVDVSGMLRYRYNESDSNIGAGASTQGNEYVFEVNTKSKVNDIVTANVSIVAQGVNVSTLDGTTPTNATESTSTTNDTVGDRDVNLVVEQANFSAALGFATVIAGKQNIPGPFVDGVDVTRQGTGAVALIPVGPVTVAAGHFVNHDINADGLQGKNATELAVIGKVADISADVWYASVADTLTALSLHANASVAGITIDARHSSLEIDSALAATNAESTLTKIVASTKLGAVSVVAGYAMTGDDNGKNGVLNRIAIDKDNDAATDFRLWQASAGQLSDASAFLIGAGMDVMPNLNLDAKYLMVDFGTNSDATEFLVGATYKVSKNFSAHTRYSMYEVKTGSTTSVDTDAGRLELKYTF
jgi:hypothetical protein